MIYTVKSFLQVTKYTPPTDILLFIATRISFINLYDAVSVEILGLKPYCSSTYMYVIHTCMCE